MALIRQVSPSRGFPGAVPYGVRTFLDPNGPRSPGQPEDGGMIPSMRGGVNLGEKIRKEEIYHYGKMTCNDV